MEDPLRREPREADAERLRTGRTPSAGGDTPDRTPSEFDPSVVGNDNIREGKVGGTMGSPRAQEGEGGGSGG